MFGSKKDFGQQLTETYQKAHAESDIGKRLLMLEALDQKLNALDLDPINVRPDFGTFLTCVGGSVASGLGAGAMFGDVGMVVGLLSGVVTGFVGGLVYDVGMINVRQKWVDNRHNAKQMKYVVPYQPVISALKAQITEDRNEILSPNNIDELRKSPVLTDVLSKYPRLIDAFKNAQTSQEKIHIPRTAANNNADVDVPKGKKENGFSL